ncbi:MAG: triose-phosphate isomerase [Nitrospinae bacterium]|nr:triose-phosphate isomerase [Nitrospinota bacterium]
MAHRFARWWLIGNAKAEQVRREEILNHARGVVKAADGLKEMKVGYAPVPEMLFEVGEIFAGSRVALGSQRVPWESDGPHTGGTSPVLLREAGVLYGIIGHREARDEFGEGPRINRQIMTALDYGIVPILCCGEPKETRTDSESQREKALEGEIIPALEGLSAELLLGGDLTIAYEPGHVIGLDKPADMDSIRSGFSLIQRILARHGLEGVAAKGRLLYGGGVNSETIQQVWNLDQPTRAFSGENWAGFLVGRSSASPDFLDLMEKWHRKLGGRGAREQGSKGAGENLPQSLRSSAPLLGPSAPPRLRPSAQIVPGIVPPSRRVKVAVYGVGEVGVGFIAGLMQQDKVEVVQLFNLQVDAEDLRARMYKSLFLGKDMVHAHGHTVCVREEIDLEGEIEIDGEPIALRNLLNGAISPTSKLVKVRRHQEMQVTLAEDPKEAAAKLRDDVDVVFFTAGGLLKERELLTPFLKAGARHIVVSSTSQASDITIIPGFNHHLFNPSLHKIVALASCTGNCGVPIAAIVEEELGKGAIVGALIVTAHSKTNSQQVGDKGSDPKEEAILNNLILTSTGIKDILTRQGFFPGIGDAVDAFSVRAPVEKSSLLVMLLQVQWAQGMSRERLREVFQRAAASDRWRGIVNYDPDHDGSKVYQNSPAGADIFGKLINVWPSPWLTDREGNRQRRSDLSTLIIPAAYANVYGYGQQAKRIMQVIGQYL